MRIILLSAFLTASLFAQHRGGGGAVAGRGHVGSSGGHSYRPRPTVVIPFAGYYSTYAPAPYAYDNSYADQTPVAIVNPNFQPDTANPTIVDYSNVLLPQPGPSTEEPSVDENGMRDDQPTIFLIALKDHSILAAIAYWADGDTLNWVSQDAKQNRISLSLVDRAFSKRLNDERHIEFKLPPAK